MNTPIASNPISSNDVRVSLLRDQVTHIVRQAILDMRLKPGQRLIDRELVEWTGVSRATVRETLRQLAAEGLVKIIPQKGAIVAKPSVKEVRELYEIRAHLEGLATRRFTEEASDSKVRELRVSFNEIETIACGPPDSWGMLQAKDRYYDLLLDGAGNETLREVLKSLLARVVTFRAAFFAAGNSQRDWVEEIRAIIAAVEAGDPIAAEQAASHHVLVSGQRGVESLIARGSGRSRYLGLKDLVEGRAEVEVP